MANGYARVSTRLEEEAGAHQPGMEAPEWWCRAGDAQDHRMTQAAFGEETGRARGELDSSQEAAWGVGGQFLMTDGDREER